MGCKSSKEVTQPTEEQQKPTEKGPVKTQQQPATRQSNIVRDSRNVRNEEIPGLPSTSPMHRRPNQKV